MCLTLFQTINTYDLSANMNERLQDKQHECAFHITSHISSMTRTTIQLIESDNVLHVMVSFDVTANHEVLTSEITSICYYK